MFSTRLIRRHVGDASQLLREFGRPCRLYWVAMVKVLTTVVLGTCWCLAAMVVGHAAIPGRSYEGPIGRRAVTLHWSPGQLTEGGIGLIGLGAATGGIAICLCWKPNIF